eukprot:TRINITY_DN79_c3_g1_i1.p1 TRINITY_DN79_c3_g1~~TRINITY_DN79_c3_g1_i1.p1  ORF type:complete len:309 (-),score=71.66 TRINITY_DN79_c3_g1_i1:786-1712(-)
MTEESENYVATLDGNQVVVVSSAAPPSYESFMLQHNKQQNDLQQQQQQQQQQQAPGSEINFSSDEFSQLYSIHRAFRFHCTLHAIILSICLACWFFVGIAAGWFPWFIYPATLSGMLIAFHFYIIIRPREWLQLHIVCFALLHIMLLLTWMVVSPRNLWFVFSFLGTGWLLGLHYILATKKEKLFLKVHGMTFTICSLIILFSWLDSKQGMETPYQWFFVPIIAMAMLYLTHRMISNGSSFLSIHIMLFGLGSIMLLSIWLIFNKTTFPWFIFPVLGWMLIVFFHSWRSHHDDSHPIDPQQVPEQQQV